MRFIVFFLFFCIAGSLAVNAQSDSAAAPKNQTDAILTDTAINTIREQFLADSIAMFYLKPDSLLEAGFVSQKLKDNTAQFASFSFNYTKPKNIQKSGVPRNFRNPWIIVITIGLLIYTALLNIFLSDDVKSVLQSFYNKNARSQIEKEGSMISIWAVMAFFVLFCFSLGLVLYQLTVYYHLIYRVSGFELFVSLSVIVGLLFALKYVVLKCLGFIFDINRVVSQYVSILNLTYFNIAFVLLFVSLCFSLLDSQFLPLLLFFTLIVIAAIFAWQYILNSVNIISNFRFHKFYLFVYLCALEICPILILIKALDI